jgi:hypothetical protein
VLLRLFFLLPGFLGALEERVAFVLKIEERSLRFRLKHDAFADYPTQLQASIVARETGPFTSLILRFLINLLSQIWQLSSSSFMMWLLNLILAIIAYKYLSLLILVKKEPIFIKKEH